MNDMRTIFGILSLLICNFIFGQDVGKQLQEKIIALEKDAQFKHAIVSMYVVDSKTGKVVFDKNSEVGLAPASCQKVITSVSAFELLGKGYRYKTNFEIWREFEFSNALKLFIIGSGDPTFGSNRFTNTSDTIIFNNFYTVFKKNGYFKVDKISIKDIDSKPIPKGWIWEDIGNYYGAGSFQLNWKENQYDLLFETGNPESCSKIKKSTSNLYFQNEVKSGKEGSGDEAYLFFTPKADTILVSGTLPPNKKSFSISGAMPYPPNFFKQDFENFARNIKHPIPFDNSITIRKNEDCKAMSQLISVPPSNNEFTFTHYSPTLDSINYWFLKKSVNLYGEAFVKTIGYEKKGVGATDTGLSIIKFFWKQRGIEPSAINIIDGSGLSPANRVTANALVTVMQYAKKQTWYSSFYNALPEMNGIKMKDGYISGVRSYTGYIKSKTGGEYTFALIVNNFDGSAATVREKLWKVLDVMK
jgi:D-alanyl-D-alanine carboxypeptidase/D-alanyl-D-alanine-endopeptidase (penicillin-binding protein 4)